METVKRGRPQKITWLCEDCLREFVSEHALDQHKRKVAKEVALKTQQKTQAETLAEETMQALKDNAHELNKTEFPENKKSGENQEGIAQNTQSKTFGKNQSYGPKTDIRISGEENQTQSKLQVQPKVEAQSKLAQEAVSSSQGVEKKHHWLNEWGISFDDEEDKAMIKTTETKKKSGIQERRWYQDWGVSFDGEE